jgi:CRP-like cAMP-binding protein
MTREDIAKICITTRESVSRTLSAWSEAGVVELRGRRILIPEPERLRRLVHVSEA